MKLKYKILWIEDEKKAIKIKARNIRAYLQDDYGFECNEEDITILDYIEFETKYINNNEIIPDSNIEEFDLLLVDFNLGEKEHTGDTLIQIIRNGNIYSEILFYSSNYEPLIKKLNEHFIDGVFTSNRDELEDKVKKLIKVTIKKVQDVNNLRGLIMAEVAELDRIKERIIIKATSIEGGFNTHEYILKTLKKSYSDNLKQVEKYKEDGIETVLNKLYVDSDKKARTISKVTTSFDEKEYRRTILGTRNKFAHVEECNGFDEMGIACKVIGDIPFTEENCITIRKEIQKYKSLLDDIDKELV